MPRICRRRRDFAFLLDADVTAADVVRAALSADRALITNVGVSRCVRGPGVPQGKKSLAIEATLQPRQKTLTDAEIEASRHEIVAAVHQGHRRRASRLVQVTSTRSGASSNPRWVTGEMGIMARSVSAVTASSEFTPIERGTIALSHTYSPHGRHPCR